MARPCSPGPVSTPHRPCTPPADGRRADVRCAEECRWLLHPSRTTVCPRAAEAATSTENRIPAADREPHRDAIRAPVPTGALFRNQCRPWRSRRPLRCRNRSGPRAGMPATRRPGRRTRPQSCRSRPTPARPRRRPIRRSRSRRTSGPIRSCRPGVAEGARPERGAEGARGERLKESVIPAVPSARCRPNR